MSEHRFTRAEVEEMVEAAVSEATPAVYATPESGKTKLGDELVKKAMLALRRRLDRAQMVAELDSYSKKKRRCRCVWVPGLLRPPGGIEQPQEPTRCERAEHPGDDHCRSGRYEWTSAGFGPPKDALEPNADNDDGGWQDSREMP